MSTAPAGAAAATARPAAMVKVLSSFTGSLQVCDGRSGPPRTAVRRPSISVVERFGRRPSNAWRSALVPPTQYNACGPGAAPLCCLLLAHDLFRKPVPTFRDHALADARHPFMMIG